MVAQRPLIRCNMVLRGAASLFCEEDRSFSEAAGIALLACRILALSWEISSLSFSFPLLPLIVCSGLGVDDDVVGAVAIAGLAFDLCCSLVLTRSCEGAFVRATGFRFRIGKGGGGGALPALEEEGLALSR